MAPTLSLSPSSSSAKLRRATVTGSYHVNRRRNTPVFTVILLVLSQNVWNTLQCGTGSPSMKNRPLVQVAPEEVESEGELLQELGNNEMGQETGDRNYGGLVGVPGKKDRNQYHQNGQNQQLIRLCSTRLLDALKKACGKNNFVTLLVEGYESTSMAPPTDLSLPELLKMASKRSVRSQGMLQRRLPRNVVNDCCYNHCSFEHMRSKFCKDQSKIPTTEGTTTVQTQTSVQPQHKPHSSNHEDTNPALYASPLAHLLRIMTERFSHPNPQPVEESSGVNSMTSVEGVNEGDMGPHEEEDERDLPMPQARIQDNPSYQGGGGGRRYQRPQASKSRQRQQGNNGHSRQSIGNEGPGRGVSGSANEGGGASFTNFPSSSFTNHLGGYPHHQQHQHPSASNYFGASSPAYFDRNSGTHTMSSFSTHEQTPEVNEGVERTSTNNVHVIPKPESPKNKGIRVWPVMDDESTWQIVDDEN